jgi:hypothetical protein
MTFKVKADDPESLRLASRFLIELDRPAQFNNEATISVLRQLRRVSRSKRANVLVCTISGIRFLIGW